MGNHREARATPLYFTRLLVALALCAVYLTVFARVLPYGKSSLDARAPDDLTPSVSGAWFYLKPTQAYEWVMHLFIFPTHRHPITPITEASFDSVAQSLTAKQITTQLHLSNQYQRFPVNEPLQTGTQLSKKGKSCGTNTKKDFK